MKKFFSDLVHYVNTYSDLPQHDIFPSKLSRCIESFTKINHQEIYTITTNNNKLKNQQLKKCLNFNISNMDKILEIQEFLWFTMPVG